MSAARAAPGVLQIAAEKARHVGCCCVGALTPAFALSTTHPVSLVGTSKSQSSSSFQTLRIKCAIQTLRIRKQRNVHAGHVVLISSHVETHVRCVVFF